jgi:hypothetical protein
MTIIELPDSYKLIPLSIFDVCLVDGLTLKQICKLYTVNDLKRKSCYQLDKFIHHIWTKYDLEIRDYIQIYLKYEWPKCSVVGGRLGCRVDGKGLRISSINPGGMNRENSPAFAASCERASKERMGEGNPMFGKDSWNKNLTKENNEILKKISENAKGKSYLTPEGRKKKSESMKGRANHAMPHSEETKEKLRRSTAGLWARGVFNRVTSIHLKMREFLKTLNLKEQFVEEYQVKYFSMDFAFPNAKIGIECQGTFYHIDPRVYPNGPKTAIQRRNKGRDVAKRKVCCDQEGWIIVEAWEIEINDGSFKEQIICKLRELNLLDESEPKTP